MRVPSLTQVLAFVEREHPDAIHVATPGPVGLCGLAAAKTLGLPLVGSYHTELGPYALHLTRDLLVAEAFDRYVDWFYRQCALVLGPTAAVADALAQKGMTTSVWGRGVDTARFTPERRDEASPRAPARRRQRAAPLRRAPVGREAGRRAARGVRAAAGRDARRTSRAGGGRAEPRGLRGAGRPSGTTFLGELHGDELATLYASADAFCFPSTTDTFGQVILEAAASGLPAAAAAAGGALELVRDGRTGLLAPPDDPIALAAAIRELSAFPERRRQVRAGRARRGARPHVAALLRRAHPRVRARDRLGRARPGEAHRRLRARLGVACVGGQAVPSRVSAPRPASIALRLRPAGLRSSRRRFAARERCARVVSGLAGVGARSRGAGRSGSRGTRWAARSPCSPRRSSPSGSGA